MIFAVISLILGIVIGYLCNFSIPMQYSQILTVLILIGLDSVFGGTKAILADKYYGVRFWSGLLLNLALAIILLLSSTYVAPGLSYAIIVVFVFRIFKNFTAIQKMLFKKK